MDFEPARRSSAESLRSTATSCRTTMTGDGSVARQMGATESARSINPIDYFSGLGTLELRPMWKTDVDQQTSNSSMSADPRKSASTPR